MNSSITFSLMKWIWISMCLICAWNWEFLIKAITFWLSSYIIIVWEYSTLYVNWVIRFRNQIVSFAIKICFVYSISQINNVTINCRFENQLMTSLLTLKAYWKEIVWDSVRMMVLKQSKRRRTLFRRRKFDILIRSI
jgi:hypothetical protein